MPPSLRTLAAISLLIVGTLALAEGAARVGLTLLAAPPALASDDLHPTDRATLTQVIRGVPSYVRPDTRLGWRVDPRGPVRSDTLAAFGDSFTHGNGVGDTETWAAQLGAANYGVPGYGLDQALLRYREVRPPARVVLIGYMSENIRRSVNAFRPFYVPGLGPPFGKPRFHLDGDSLRLRPNPLPDLDAYRALLTDPAAHLPRIGAGDAYWRASRWHRSALLRLVSLARRSDPYDPAGEPFRVTVATFDAFVRAVRSDGAEPVILLFPHQGDLGEPSYLGLRDTLTAHGHRVLDLREAFRDCGGCEAAFWTHHYSPEGNRRVADFLRIELTRPSGA